MNDYLIDLYLKYYDTREKYERIYKRSFNELLKEIETELSVLSLKELFDAYIKYSRVNYLKNSYLNSLLNLIYEDIQLKINDNNPIEIIDMHADLFSSMLSLEDNIQSYKNIIRVRTYNLADPFFISNKIEKTNQEQAVFIQEYKDEIETFNQTLKISQSSFNYLDKLHNLLMECLDNKIVSLSTEERNNLIRDINKRIELYFSRINYQKNLLNNKTALELEIRLKGLNSYDIAENFNFAKLKNKLEVYEDYQNRLLEQKNKNK